MSACAYVCVCVYVCVHEYRCLCVCAFIFESRVRFVKRLEGEGEGGYS